MILAVMQPYLFPYVGYYQLAYHADMFIFYDDVNYIKSGYINRNNIQTKNGKQLFTVPVNQASSFKKINELEFSNNIKKVLSGIQQAYSKAPNFDVIYPIVEKVLSSSERNVANITSSSVIEVFDYLGLEFKYEFSSNLNYDRSLDAKRKLFEFCRLYEANKYVNTPGGKALYDKKEFNAEQIELSFIEMEDIVYSQFNNKIFEKNLSMIDVLMNLSKNEILSILRMYSLR